MSKQSATQTLAAILEGLGLEKGITAEEALLAISVREEAARAARPARAARVPTWTPVMTEDGEVRLSGSRVRLAADEIDPCVEALASDGFRQFIAANADALLAREDVNAGRKARRAAAKEADEPAADA